MHSICSCPAYVTMGHEHICSLCWGLLTWHALAREQQSKMTASPATALSAQTLPVGIALYHQCPFQLPAASTRQSHSRHQGGCAQTNCLRRTAVIGRQHLVRHSSFNRRRAGIMTNLELKPAVAAARSEMYAATLCRPSDCDACSKRQIHPQTIVGILCSMQSVIWYFSPILGFVPAPGELFEFNKPHSLYVAAVLSIFRYALPC